MCITVPVPERLGDSHKEKKRGKLNAPILLPAILLPAIHFPAIRVPAILLPAIRVPAILFPVIRVPAILLPAIRLPAIHFPAIHVPAIIFPGILLPVIRVATIFYLASFLHRPSVRPNSLVRTRKKRKKKKTFSLSLSLSPSPPFRRSTSTMFFSCIKRRLMQSAAAGAGGVLGRTLVLSVMCLYNVPHIPR